MRRAGELRKRPRAEAWLVVASALAAACGSKTPPTSPPCDQQCRDGIALRALRETMKYTYNWTVQGKPVGPQDAGTDRFLTGSAQVVGVASSDPLQGTTTVGLSYVFMNTSYSRKDDAPQQNYDVVINGTIWQEGTLAVQPSSTTSLFMCGTDIRIVGEVYDPPLKYDLVEGASHIGDESGCIVAMTQNGSDVAGRLCQTPGDVDDAGDAGDPGRLCQRPGDAGIAAGDGRKAGFHF